MLCELAAGAFTITVILQNKIPDCVQLSRPSKPLWCLRAMESDVEFSSMTHGKDREYQWNIQGETVPKSAEAWNSDSRPHAVQIRSLHKPKSGETRYLGVSKEHLRPSLFLGFSFPAL